jgi:hypothetical protein
MCRFITYALLTFFLLATSAACNTPLQSQKFFAQAVKNDPMLEPLHQTALYTVYFDHALRRCVLHSAYTWGESGGGTGGTGLGVSVFACNPRALKAHVNRLKKEIGEGVSRFELPQQKPARTTPKQSLSRKTSRPEQPRLSTPQVAPVKAPPAQTPTTETPAENSNAPNTTSGVPSLRSTPETTSDPGDGNGDNVRQNKPDKPATGTKLLQPITMP